MGEFLLHLLRPVLGFCFLIAAALQSPRLRLWRELHPCCDVRPLRERPRPCLWQALAHKTHNENQYANLSCTNKFLLKGWGREGRGWVTSHPLSSMCTDALSLSVCISLLIYMYTPLTHTMSANWSLWIYHLIALHTMEDGKRFTNLQ